MSKFFLYIIYVKNYIHKINGKNFAIYKIDIKIGYLYPKVRSMVLRTVIIKHLKQTLSLTQFNLLVEDFNENHVNCYDFTQLNNNEWTIKERLAKTESSESNYFYNIEYLKVIKNKS